MAELSKVLHKKRRVRMYVSDYIIYIFLFLFALITFYQLWYVIIGSFSNGQQYASGGGFCGYGRRRIRIPLGGEDRARTVFSDDPADPVVSYATGVDREGFLRFFEGTLGGPGEGGDKLNYFKNISDHPVIPEGGKE